MPKLSIILALLIACPALADRQEREDKSARLFQMDRMLTIHIRLSAQQWRMMQPEKASRLATAMGIVQHPTTRQVLEAAEPKRKAAHERVEGERRPPGLVGNQYAYVAARVEIDGKTFDKVGLRYKGQWAYTLSGDSPRRPLKIKFDHFVDGQRFEGVEGFSLNTSALDPSLLRETLGFAAFREAGIAAPRTCLALVYLTAEGTYDRELLGLYTAIEEVDKDFLRRNFGTSKGLLVRPERTRNLAYLGEDFEEYSRYNLQSEGSEFTARRFIDFTRTVHLAGDESFASQIGAILDYDEFARFVAANVLIINLDSMLANGHNYYIYIHPRTGRVHYIPWDLHLAFGYYGKTIDEWVNFTIDRPYRENNRLLERMMSVGGLRESYREYLREFAAGCFSPAKMHPRIEQLEKVIASAQAIARLQGKELPITNPSGHQQRAELKPFVTGRCQSIFDQLAGKIEGEPFGGRRAAKPAAPQPRIIPPKPAPPVKHVHPPKIGRPDTVTKVPTLPPKPAVAPPKPVIPPKPRPTLPHPLAQLLLRTIDVDRDAQLNREEFLDSVKHVYMAHARVRRGPVDCVSLAETFDRLGTILNPYPAPAEETEPDLSALSLTWARAILLRADVHQQGIVGLDDLLACAAATFDEADANHDGVLNAHELTAALDRIVPRP